MDVLVLGGTGLIGRALAPELLSRGHRVTVLSRGRSRPEWWERVAHIPGERATFTLDANFDAVIDNLAYARADTEHAMRALRGRTAHYVHTSSMSVYNYWKFDRPVREEGVDLAAPAHNDYAAGKRAAEAAVDGDFAVTIFRPPILEGPHDATRRTWYWIRRIRDGETLVVPPGFRVRNLWTGDLARAYADALERPGGVYNVAMAETFTGREYVEAVARAMGRETRIVEGDAEPPQFLRQVIDTTRVERDLGFRATPFADWMPGVAAWHLASATQGG